MARTQNLNDDRNWKKELKKACKNTPKYLFRMWHSESGGNPGLNTTTRIVPHRFYINTGYHCTVYNFTRSELQTNVDRHLRWEPDHTDSEFSSWTASIRFALRYATQNMATAHIAIIDTEKLSEFNAIFHVPALERVLGKSYGAFREEYLAHGVIQGEGYRAVSFQALCERGLTPQFPELNHYNEDPWAGARKPLPEVSELTTHEVRLMYRMAGLYGSTFSVPFIIALIGLKQRSSDLWENITSEEISMVLRVLPKSKIPDWTESRGIMCDDGYDLRYPDTLQMVRLMRAISSHCFGHDFSEDTDEDSGYESSEGSEYIPSEDSTDDSAEFSDHDPGYGSDDY